MWAKKLNGSLLKTMKRFVTVFAVGVLAATLVSRAGATSLEAGFAAPPAQTKPWCYWYWTSDNLSREGITKDLEAMARVGIGEALIGNIFLDDVPAGKVKVLSEEWWGIVEHAIREGGRVGVDIGMFNCPGWSQSGGPWIKPEQSMRYLVSSETRVAGPTRFEQKLPAPDAQFQDLAVLAFRAPLADRDSAAARSLRVTCTPSAEGVMKVLDGDVETTFDLPPGAGSGKHALSLDFEFGQPFTARSLALTPGSGGWSAQCVLEAANDGGEFREVHSFKFDRSNMNIGVGPMPCGPVTVSFPATATKRFRITFTGVTGKAALAELDLSGAARLESFVEKQLGKMHPTPLPMWDTYLWPTQPEPDSPKLAVPPGEVLDLTAKLSPDGTLRWDASAGDWIILRTGLTPTGTKNSPASPEGQGLEVDKMNRRLAKHHFDAFIGEVLRRMPAADRRAFKHVVADSYEMGSQNWTDGFGEQFKKRYGYDPKPWLPVLTGRLVGSVDQSERFLWDLRRLVADRVATDYVGGLREQCHQHGLQLWLENYGHWGFPSEFLKYGSESDRIGGEFWVTGDLGSIECRAASSCANTYGKAFVSAEAFTGGPAFQTAPWGLKARGDWAFCEGINHFVLHVYIHQPWEDKVPGVNAWFGTEFNRHNTWFEPGKAWVDYLRRSCWLLQQGTRVADVAYFIGDDAPKMTGVRKPELPAGCDFEYINSDVIEQKLRVKNGLLTLPHGTTYRVLVLPELTTMRPEVLRKIRDLVKAGATVVGTPPSRSPSMENFPRCDTEVQKLAREIWGEFVVPASAGLAGTPPKGGTTSGERKFGKGQVIWGKSLDEILASLGVPPDFQSQTKLRFTHRRSGSMDIYFVANPQAREITTTTSFRVGSKAPEFWWPDSGRIDLPAVYDVADDCVQLPLSLGPHGSVFVVFRTAAARDRVVSVVHDGRVLVDARRAALPADGKQLGGAPAPNSFTMAIWAKPSADTTLLPEQKAGVQGMAEPRNDALFPPHGGDLGGPGHSGCGIAIGRNGVAVFEHGANYFTPLLVHATPLTDWTHVAVVYRNGQPSLYLNGKLAHTGLRSDYVVHAGAGSGASGNSAFRGQLGVFEVRGTLDEDGIAALMKSMPRPDQPTPGSALRLVRGAKGLIEAQVSQAGIYELWTADGKPKKLEVPSVPEPIALRGSWEVSFTPGWGAPEGVTFDALTDWTKRSEDGIRHYSGQATYRQRFSLPAFGDSNLKPQIVLDLGDVRDMAIVRVNGKQMATLWLAQWQVDITSAVKLGENTLEVEVVNPWNNRLVGDAALPATQRKTFLLAKTLNKDAPLMPAGLLGPVSVRTIPIVELK